MEEQESGYGRIRVRYIPPGEAEAKYLARIHKAEQKYGMTSAEMERLFSTGDDHWDTVEILKRLV